ncbi:MULTISPECIES: hypothetical protein [Ralstonia]|jgi:hypothetical protein|uniref:Methyltransferase type 11 domain-containing protein n=1 Tax=Ralstonia pickettii OR214 TaxID=1264675 RepID=R0CTD6_RALPI|nr:MULTISPECIES: hypothetical protein [Ralstonia]ENZ79640.1 hypothetical protein OR214_00057 [Ralstonia pickettii OR214]MBE3066987.1 hypothetical protein [Chloroflexota bacterium]MBL4778397.1 hypothetical protein [Ralstonia sp.]MCM3582174.1 class I SAM-dependent methyltransferase [Ralstonia pickettii]
MDRSAFLTLGLCKDRFGIEIGPFYNPVAPKSHGWNTIVVDFTDQNGLLNIARTHTDQGVRDRIANIEHVDVVWDGQPLDEACLSMNAQGFQYLIASHVIEHVPDIVGFLGQVSNLATEDFVLSLAVPDCRQIFDFFKPLSTTADALLAHRSARKLHSPETIFVARAYMTWRGGSGAWGLNRSADFSLPETLDSAHQQYLSYLSGLESGTQTYVDSHCWYWTPSSFALMILELNHLGYISFVIEEMVPGPASEFLVRLKRGKHDLTDQELHERRLQLMLSTRAELFESSPLDTESPVEVEVSKHGSFAASLLRRLRKHQPA